MSEFEPLDGAEDGPERLHPTDFTELEDPDALEYGTLWNESPVICWGTWRAELALAASDISDMEKHMLVMCDPYTAAALAARVVMCEVMHVQTRLTHEN